MEELPWEKRFHFHDGAAAKDLRELKEKIETISYEEFYRYVGEHHNHFANWIEHVLHAKPLADRLRAVSSIVETVELLDEELHHGAGAHGSDLQARIEQQLFEPGEIPASLDDEPEQAPVARRHEEHPLFERHEERPLFEPQHEEPRLPSHDELEFAGRTPRAPVTSSAPAHAPITWKAEKPTHEEHLRFITKESVMGLLMGLVAGFILGRVVSLYMA